MKNAAALVLSLSAAGWGCASDNNVFDQINTDTWSQAPTNQVDILWVIDDSGSMAEEQDILNQGFSAFARQLEEPVEAGEDVTDFHMGVITTSFDYTDPNRGRLVGDPPVLTRDDDYLAAFALRSTVGTEGSDKEKGLEAATFALHPSLTLDGGLNEGFVRKDAYLLVVFVSDEEDCSDNGALEGQPPEACYAEVDDLPPVQTYVEDLRDLKSDPAQVQIASIVGTQSSECADVLPGRRYVAAASLTGGLVGDICQGNWEGMLGDLGLNATGIHTQFQLTDAAKPETLEVVVDDVPVLADPVSGWTYDEATWYVEFHGSAVPPRGAAVSATYTVQPGVPEPTATAR